MLRPLRTQPALAGRWHPGAATGDRGLAVAANTWTTLTFEFLTPSVTPVFGFTGGARSESVRVCHLLSEKREVSASEKKKLAPAKTTITHTANTNPAAMGAG